MAREYNYIYKRLVEDESDMVGHIAYSLYKADKITYISNFKSKNKREPTEDDLIQFNDATNIESIIKRYKSSAAAKLKSFLDNTLSESVHQLEAQCQKNYRDNIKEVLAPLTPASKARRYGEGILQGLIGALLFALLVAAIAFIIQFKGADFSINLKTNQQSTEIELMPTK